MSKKTEKEEALKEVREKAEKSYGMVLIGYKGIKANEMNHLRAQIKKCKSELKIVKNIVIHRMLDTIGLSNMSRFVQGQSGLVFLYDENILSPLRFLFEFSKTNKNLEIRGGCIYKKVLEPKELEELSKVSSKEELVSRIILLIKQRISGLIFALRFLPNRLLYVLHEIKNKRSS